VRVRGPMLAAAVGLVAAVAMAQEGALIERGVFTVAQAERGRGQYQTHCVECHAPDLGGTTFGDGAPALKGNGFLEGDNLYAVFDEMKRAMPFNAPGSLSESVYIDVLAYVLRENGYPAGSEELKPDPAVLKQIVVPKK
jgi:mono/diheme cytochrome c family protein